MCKHKWIKVTVFILLAIIAIPIYILIDFTYLFSPLFPIFKTDETELILRDGIMFTSDGELFSGTSVFKGYFVNEEYPEYAGNKGKRITPYKNGLKDGTEFIYHTDHIPYIPATRTVLHQQTTYRKGLKHGKEIVNYSGSNNHMIEVEYCDGVRNGMYREFHLPMTHSKKKYRNTGPLSLETRYSSGVIDEFYGTYNYYGDTSEFYTCKKGVIIDGRMMLTLDTAHCWKWFENGYLVKERFFDPYTIYGNSEEPPLAYNTCGGVLLHEIFYQNGQIIEERKYNPENHKVRLHRKMVDGVLVELFNAKSSRK